jgi:hypothetical protein
MARRDEIDYVSIASTGNATDFGDLTASKIGMATCGSTTRLVYGGGYDGSYTNVIEYLTISSTGDGTDFGDLTLARSSPAGCSNSTRGIFAAGFHGSSGAVGNNIDYITIASAGNATDFGDVTQSRYRCSGASSSTRATFAGGFAYANDGGGAAINDTVNIIDAVTIASTGNATDHGDLTAIANVAGGSNSHGGIS